jgi:hypothetical protein
VSLRPRTVSLRPLTVSLRLYLHSTGSTDESRAHQLAARGCADGQPDPAANASADEAVAPGVSHCPSASMSRDASTRRRSPRPLTGS